MSRRSCAGGGMMSVITAIVLFALGCWVLMAVCNRIFGVTPEVSTSEAQVLVRAAARVHYEAGRQVEKLLDTSGVDYQKK